MSAVTAMRLHLDGAGESRWQPLQIDLASTEFAPPAPPMEVSPMQAAAGWRFLRLPPRWVGDWHPTPVRLWIFCLGGEMEFQASDGAVHRVEPGSAMLLEDTSGRGHRSRVTGDRHALLVAVQV